MSLLEILANHLKVWPYVDLPFATQEADGEIWFSECIPYATTSGLVTRWETAGFCTSSLDYSSEGHIAEDYATAIVTESQWEYAVRLKKNELLQMVSSIKNDEQQLLSSIFPSMTCREFLSEIYLDWKQHKQTLKSFSQMHRISTREAAILLTLANEVCRSQSPFFSGRSALYS